MARRSHVGGGRLLRDGDDVAEPHLGRSRPPSSRGESPCFLGGTRAEVDAIVSDAEAHGWRPLYQERYPHAGGPDHHAGWVENDQGFKVEIVAEPPA